jgi:hypothetical protein
MRYKLTLKDKIKTQITGKYNAVRIVYENKQWNGVFWDVTSCGSCKELLTSLQEPHSVSSQKTPFFIVTAVKTSNPIYKDSTFIFGWKTHKLYIFLNAMMEACRN